MDLGEGTIAESLTALQEKYPNIDIGSYPQMRQDKGFTVSLVWRGRDKELLNQAHRDTMQAMRNLGGNPMEEDPESSQASAEPENKWYLIQQSLERYWALGAFVFIAE